MPAHTASSRWFRPMTASYSPGWQSSRQGHRRPGECALSACEIRFYSLQRAASGPFRRRPTAEAEPSNPHLSVSGATEHAGLQSGHRGLLATSLGLQTRRNAPPALESRHRDNRMNNVPTRSTRQPPRSDQSQRHGVRMVPRASIIAKSPSFSLRMGILTDVPLLLLRWEISINGYANDSTWVRAERIRAAESTCGFLGPSQSLAASLGLRME